MVKTLALQDGKNPSFLGFTLLAQVLGKLFISLFGVYTLVHHMNSGLLSWNRGGLGSQFLVADYILTHRSG